MPLGEEWRRCILGSVAHDISSGADIDNFNCESLSPKSTLGFWIDAINKDVE